MLRHIPPSTHCDNLTSEDACLSVAKGELKNVRISQSCSPAKSESTFNQTWNKTTCHSDLARKVIGKLNSSLDSSRALAVIADATEGDFYIFGGNLRRSLLGTGGSGDLDLIVNNGDIRARQALRRLGLSYTFNSQGHQRFQWNKLQIDLCTPEKFFTGFDTADAMLSFVDLHINGIALHFGTKEIIDKFDVCSKNHLICAGINWVHWRQTDTNNLTVMAIRLAKVLFDAPNLRLSRSDVDQLEANVLPSLSRVDWHQVRYRFPEGREVFLQLLNQLIAERKA